MSGTTPPAGFSPCGAKHTLDALSATDSQKHHAHVAAEKAYRHITNQLQLPAPIVADSGSGFHLLLRLDDLPNDSQSKWVCKELLKLLADQFRTDTAEIDASVYNASCVCKLAGTVARKGADISEQPLRLASLVSVPDPIVPTTLEQLCSVVGHLSRFAGRGFSGASSFHAMIR